MVETTSEQHLKSMNKSLSDISDTLKAVASKQKESERAFKDFQTDAEKTKFREIENQREERKQDEAIVTGLEKIASGLTATKKEKGDAFGLKELLLGLTAGLLGTFEKLRVFLSTFFKKFQTKLGNFFKIFKLDNLKKSLTNFFGRIIKFFKKFKIPKVGEAILKFFGRVSSLFKNFKIPKISIPILAFFTRISNFFKKFKIPKINPQILGFFTRISNFFKKFKIPKINPQILGFFTRVGNFFKNFKIPKIGENVRAFFTRVGNFFKNFKIPKIGESVRAFFTRVGNFFKTIRLEVGQFRILPKVTEFISRVMALFASIRLPQISMPKGLKSFISAVTGPEGLMTRIGNFFSTIQRGFSRFVKMGQAILKPFGAFAELIKPIGDTLKFLGKIASRILAPLGLIFTIGSGAIEAFDAAQKGENFTAILSAFLGGIGEFLSFGFVDADEIKETLLGGVTNIFENIKDIFRNGLTPENFKGLFGSIGELIGGIGDLALKGVTRIIAWIGGFFGFEEVEKKLTKFAKEIDIFQTAKDLVDGIGKWMGNIFEEVMNFLKKLSLSNIVEGAFKGVGSGFDKVKSFFFGDDVSTNNNNSNQRTQRLIENADQFALMKSRPINVPIIKGGDQMNLSQNETNFATTESRDKSFKETSDPFSSFFGF